MKNNQSIIASGYSNLCDSLNLEEKERISKLKDEMRKVKGEYKSQMKALKNQIKEVKLEYKDKRKSAKGSLF
jgi:hypothetical protein